MGDPHHGMDIAAGVEVGLQLHPERIGGGNQIIKDAVGHLLMGDRLIAVAVHVQLDRLKLNHPWAWLVDQAQHRKIGIPRERALTSELRQLNRYLIGATRSGVVKADQLRLSDGTLAVKGGLGLLVCQRNGSEI